MLVPKETNQRLRANWKLTCWAYKVPVKKLTQETRPTFLLASSENHSDAWAGALNSRMSSPRNLNVAPILLSLQFRWVQSNFGLTILQCSMVWIRADFLDQKLTSNSQVPGTQQSWSSQAFLVAAVLYHPNLLPKVNLVVMLDSWGVSLDPLKWKIVTQLFASVGIFELMFSCSEIWLARLLAILDDKLLLYMDTLKKRLNESFVVMRMQTRRQGILKSKRQNAIWCQPESAMFCTHLSHFGYTVQLLPERGFSYTAWDEEMPKPHACFHWKPKFWWRFSSKLSLTQQHSLTGRQIRYLMTVNGPGMFIHFHFFCCAWAHLKRQKIFLATCWCCSQKKVQFATWRTKPSNFFDGWWKSKLNCTFLTSSA